MKEWWAGLQPRERQLLRLAAVLLAALLLYALVWQPLQRAREAQAERLERAEESLRWMRGAVAELQSLRAAGRPEPDPRPLLTVVDATAKAAELQGTIRRIQPVGSDDVRVTLEGASYRAVVSWLADMHTRGVQVRELSAQRDAEPGRVSANLVLHRSGG